MRRRSFLYTILIIGATLGAVVTVIAVLLKRDPEFYSSSESDIPDDPTVAPMVLTRFSDLQNDMREKANWGGRFTVAELNAFLREHLDDGEGLASVLPSNLHTPRVSIDGDRIRIAARYQLGESATFSTVVWVDLRIWLVKDELNTIAIELVGAWAGSLPIEWKIQSKLDLITETARDSLNADVTWYRHDGHPVGLFHFYADQRNPTTRFKSIHVSENQVTVTGKSMVDPTMPTTPDPAPPAE
ncbi:hypothetical protein [Fimbriiglobus ruber]|uniref:Uncharacterized protein n=1 Tax=Fimbriiglobus ruber TaxID=1908690 RepID=A0A225E637_9BACT|nr:hypothetical protein [Fimbriiglobus ruber]OWK43887.1 hypothetical protein FRUB_03486 [Fimbriiglobus ruber]